MVKKILAVFGILIVLLVASLIVLPIIFKDDIVQIVKDAANDNLNAIVNFGDFDLSLISSFPDFSFSISDVAVAGLEPFDKDTLVAIGKLHLTVDLMSVINGDEIAIKTILVDGLKANAIVLENGIANWDIVKETAEEEPVEEEEEADTASTPFKMKLKKFEIKNTYIVYDDREGGLFTEIRNLNFDLSGDFTEDFTALETHTSIDAFTFAMEGVKYMKEANIEINADLDADLINSKYTFKENEFRLNQLVLSWDGWVAMPDENIDMDIKFGAKKTEFKNILSLVPAVYAKEFDGLKTAGKLALDGYAKGKMTDTELPAFGLELLVENAMFQYPDLPSSADNININVNVSNPGGSEDNTVIDISKFHIELANNPIDIHMVLKTPISDPQIDCGVEGEIDLEKLKDIVPLEDGEEMSGLIKSDIVIKGRMSTIEEERYEDFEALGNLIVENLSYKSVDLPQGILIEKVNMVFSPAYVDLIAFDCKLGNSDFHANGKIENFIPFALTDSVTLVGSFNLKSGLLDLNEFMEEETDEEELAEETSLEEDTVPFTVIEVPGNIDFSLASSFTKILYDNMEMTDVTGALVVKDKTVFMDDIIVHMLGGEMKVNGSYSTLDITKPNVDFDLEIKNFDIQESFKTFNTVQKLAPITENCAGAFSTGMEFKTLLLENMEPDLNTMNGKGLFNTEKVTIEGSETINKLANALKNDKYKKLVLTDVNATFEFHDGRLYVEPFDVMVGNSKATIYGSNGFDESLDYTMEMIVPTAEFGGGAEAALGSLVSLMNQSGANVSVGEEVEVKILIGGTVSDPKVKIGGFNPLGGGQSVKEVVKEEIKEKIEEVKEEVKEEIKKNVKEQADKIIKEAEKQAEAIKRGARNLGAQTKKEGYAQAKKLEDDAKNPLQKVTAKVAAELLRKETDKKVDNIISAADKKANDLVNKARIKAAALQK
ncbi:MAG TPA: AsmA family protein [Flavobacteriales bacterium]|nr:AsmA family protein [Flavobacteriales bacterium]